MVRIASAITALAAMLLICGCDPFFSAKLEVDPVCAVKSADWSQIIEESVRAAMPAATVIQSKYCNDGVAAGEKPLLCVDLVMADGDSPATITVYENEEKCIVTIDSLTDSPQLWQIRREVTKRLLGEGSRKPWEVHVAYGFYREDENF